MANQAPWPVRKGIFRSTGQSDFVPTRTPSPVVEMPMTPQPRKNSSNPLSPIVTIVESPLSPPPPPPTQTPTTATGTPTNSKTFRDVPIIEVYFSSFY